MSKKKWWGVIKVLFYLLKKILLFVGLMVVAFILSPLITQEVAISLIGSIFLLVILYDFLRLMTKLTYQQDIKKLKKSYKEYKKISLYRWSEGVEIEERAFYHVLLDDASRNPMANLKALKRNIENLCEGDKTNLKLLDAYIDRRLISNFFDKFWSFLLGIVVSGITAIFKKLAVGEKVINIIYSFINFSSDGNITKGFVLVINYVTYFIIILLLVSYYSHLFTRDKERLKLIKSVINISIDEN